MSQFPLPVCPNESFQGAFSCQAHFDTRIEDVHTVVPPVKDLSRELLGGFLRLALSKSRLDELLA